MEECCLFHVLISHPKLDPLTGTPKRAVSPEAGKNPAEGSRGGQVPGE